MLAELRHKFILDELEKKDSVTVVELTEMLNASESTIRRDIVALDKEGKLTKVFGGAVSLEGSSYSGYERSVEQKYEVNQTEKKNIALYAAGMIDKDDFVFIDAGTTTAQMIDYVRVDDVTYVTNAISHAKSLALRGAHVILLGGELRGLTEAVVGDQAMQSLVNFNFTKSFIGANGISRKAGITTPSIDESVIKKMAIRKSKESVVLMDSSKFNNIFPVKFADIDDVDLIISDTLIKGYEKYHNIVVVGADK